MLSCDSEAKQDHKWYCFSGRCQLIQVNSPIPDTTPGVGKEFYIV